MMRASLRRHLVRLAFGVALACGSAWPAAAQAQTPPEPAPAESAADFLFGAPHAWLGVRGSYLVPRAGGDFFTFVRDQLTLDTADFRAAGLSGDLGIVLPHGLDVVVGADVNRRTAPSEYRHFIASNGQPIAQTTRVRQTGVRAGLRWSPLSRGQRISRLAFIPRRVVPYVDAGVTTTFYSWSQVGQFVDANSFAVFNDHFGSDGWATGPYAGGGVDLQLYRVLYFTVHARYTWLHGALGSDFTGFDGIDLSGLRTSTGFTVMF